MTKVHAQLGPGLRAAFLQSPELTVAEAMTRSPGQGSWSPDGTKIAFFWVREETVQLWVMPAGGGWPLQLTDTPLAIHVYRSIVDRRFTVGPQWSPDGKHIAFVARLGEDKEAGLWVVSLAGGEPRRLTRHRGSDWCPRWSPDGKHIAFVSLREGTNDLWVVPAEGGTPLQLTYDRFDNIDPQWSPDAKHLVFTSQRSDLDWFCNNICMVAAAVAG